MENVEDTHDMEDTDDGDNAEDTNDACDKEDADDMINKDVLDNPHNAQDSESYLFAQTEDGQRAPEPSQEETTRTNRTTFSQTPPAG